MYRTIWLGRASTKGRMSNAAHQQLPRRRRTRPARRSGRCTRARFIRRPSTARGEPGCTVRRTAASSSTSAGRGRARSMAMSATIRAGRGEETSTRSLRATASVIEWVTNSVVTLLPSTSWFSRPRISARVISSSAANGSSISSSGAPSASARTRATRCCMPPDSSCGWASRNAAEADPSSSSIGIAGRRPVGLRG